MPKTFVAQSVNQNHDYDFSVDGQGNIVAMMVRAEVNYGTMGRMESLDMWPLLTAAQKVAVQAAYGAVRQRFNQVFLD